MTDYDRLAKVPWFIAGLGLGALTALLLAPRSGRETRHLIVEKGIDKAEDLIGEERVQRGRQIYRRGEEIRDLAKDTVDVARRARRVARPLESDGGAEDDGG